MLRHEQVLATLMDLASRSGTRSRPELLLAALRVAISLAEADGGVLALGAGRQLERLALRRGEDAPAGGPEPREPGVFERALLRVGLPRALADLAETRRAVEVVCPGVDAGPALFVPMRLHERETGYLALFRRRGAPRFAGRDAREATLLTAWLAAALQNLRLGESLEKLAVTDELTQVFNYRYLKSALRREIKRAARCRQPLSLLMIDVDNLKAYNDRNGHLRGSHLLREIAQLFAQQVRSWDLVAKYGGDEFTIILPQTERPGATTVGERLRAAVEAHAFPLADRGAITVSLGIAAFPGDGDTGSTLIESADRALYRAKRLGRNRVEGGDTRAA